MNNILYIYLLLIGIILSFTIIYQIPNSYSQLYSKESFANMYGKQENKGTYNTNINENDYDDNFNLDNLINDELYTSDFDNNKVTNNKMVTDPESLPNKDYGSDSNLGAFGKLVKKIYEKQIHDENLNDKHSSNKQNNSSSEEIEINKIFDNLLNVPSFQYEDSSSKDFDNNNLNYKENFPDSSETGNDNDNLNNRVDDFIQSDSDFSSFPSKSISSQKPSVDTHYVQVFDKNGNFIKSWGETGQYEGKFLHPHGIAVDSKGYVYITDEMRSKVLKFDSDGNFIKEWGEKGKAIDQFSPRIEDIDVDSNDNVYVVDYGQKPKILKFDSDGNFIFSLGGSKVKGKGIGEFNRPWGVNVDSEGNIYIAEKLNYRISKYSPSGHFITTWGKNSTADGDFLHLHAVGVDSSHNNYVYATDEDKGGVQKFTSDGQFITKWGKWGKDEGQMREVHGIATDSEGSVYVADTKNSRIQKFTPDGELVTMWGVNGLGDGKFLMVHDLDIDSNDNVYVIDQRGAHPDKSNAEKYLKIDKDDLEKNDEDD